MFDSSALSALLLWSAKLRSQQPIENYDRVRQELHGLLDAFYQQALGLTWSKEQADLGRYALCAGIDEAAMTRADSFSDSWAGRPLQLSLYGEYTAGRGFFDRLEILRQDIENNYAVVAVYWMMLSHGFAGKLVLEPKARRDALIYQLKTELMPYLPSLEVQCMSMDIKTTAERKIWDITNAAIKPLIWLAALAVLVSVYVLWSGKTQRLLNQLSTELNQLNLIDANRAPEKH